MPNDDGGDDDDDCMKTKLPGLGPKQKLEMETGASVCERERAQQQKTLTAKRYQTTKTKTKGGEW